MRELLILSVLGLGGAGAYFLQLAIDSNTPAAQGVYALVAGLVSWVLATTLLIIGIFALRNRP
jgi:hypothetical protein